METELLGGNVNWKLERNCMEVFGKYMENYMEWVME